MKAISPVEALGAQRAQHRHHGGDAAAARHEQDAPWALRRQHEVPAHRVQADHHSGPGMVIEVGGHQAGVVATDRQFDVRVTLGIRGRVRTGAPTAVDLDREVYVLAREETREGPVGLECQGDAARGLAPHGDHLRAGVSLGPGRGDQLCVPVHTVWPGQQVDQRRPEHPPRQSLSEHMYTLNQLPAERQPIQPGCVRFHIGEQSYS